MEIGTETGAQPHMHRHRGDGAFLALSRSVQGTFDAMYSLWGERLFRVDSSGLMDVFLDGFEDAGDRRWHTCGCCRGFMRRYGGLVVITDEGEVKSALWNENVLLEGTRDVYANAIEALRREVESRRVLSAFSWRSGRWGVPIAGGFDHFFIDAEPGPCPATLTPGQHMADLVQAHETLRTAVQVMDGRHVRRAVEMLEAGGLIRAETLLPQGRFLRDLQIELIDHRRQQHTLLWRAVSRASRGWCSPRSSAFGALVDDIAEGLSVEAITRAHNQRLDPLHYQRPKAPPSAGNVAQAEKLIVELGLAPALKRRPMALEEAELVWRPAPLVNRAVTGVFGHLLEPRGGAVDELVALSAGATSITFAKFRRDVLPKARAMRVLTPSSGNYAALTTAVDASAPPLMKWDRQGRRNPGAWYLYTNGSSASSWGLPANTRVPVLGVCLLPPDWYGETAYGYQTNGRALFVLEGAADRSRGSLGLFPECLRSELHAVRATLEAHSKSGRLEDEERQRASGLLLADGVPLDVFVIVETGSALYRIDRAE